MTPSRLAAGVLAQVLGTPRFDDDAAHGRLRYADATRVEVQALLPLLDGLRIEEWVGDSGVPYRDYIGRLSCGLILVVRTDAAHVPPVDPAGGSDA